MIEPDWLEPDILLLLHREALVVHGGADGLRHPGLLDSALARPRNLNACGEADVIVLAAAYAGGIVRNHPFVDGNKRAGFIAAVTFLEINCSAIDLPEGEAIAAMLDLAAGDLPEAGFAAWLRDHLAPRA